MRRIIAFMVFLCLFCSSVRPASGTMESATDAARRGADQILALLQDPAFHNPATKEAQRKKIENAMLGLFDFDEFSFRTVGPNWRNFTPDQKKRFQEAFTTLLRNTYIDTLDSYSGEKVEFTGEISGNNGTRSEVRMNFLGKDAVHPVAFRMLVKNGRWVVYDVLIEGISMIKNYRDQFRDLLAKGNPDELISRISAKAEEVKNQPKQK